MANPWVYLSGRPAEQVDTGIAANQDGGGDDAFVFTGGVNTLVSRQRNGTPVGSGASVTNPTISSDGTVVHYVSTVNAANIGPLVVPFAPQGIRDDNSSPDLFRVNVNAPTSAIPLSYAVVGFITSVAVVNLITTPTFATGLSMFGDVSVDPLGRYATPGLGCDHPGLSLRLHAGFQFQCLQYFHIQF